MLANYMNAPSAGYGGMGAPAGVFGGGHGAIGAPAGVFGGGILKRHGSTGGCL
jgi:hypothetical protein